MCHWIVSLWLQVIYENKARLLCTAEGSPQDLFQKIVTISEAKQRAPRTSSRSRKNDEADLCVDNELGFTKDRTISRYDISLWKCCIIIFDTSEALSSNIIKYSRNDHRFYMNGCICCNYWFGEISLMQADWNFQQRILRASCCLVWRKERSEECPWGLKRFDSL